MARRKRFGFRERIRRVYVRGRRRARKAHEKFTAYVTHHPLGVAGIAVGVGTTLELVTAPLPNGDGWIPRLEYAMANPGNPLALDPDGNSILSVTGHQISTNIWPALPGYIGAAALMWADSKFHLKGR